MEDRDFDALIDRIEARDAKPIVLSSEQIQTIAEQAAKKALELVYAEVGKNTVKGALWIIGAFVLAALAWLGVTGKVSIK